MAVEAGKARSCRGRAVSRQDSVQPPAVAFCYAEGAGDHWEAYCLTFDLAVSGRSFSEVRQKIGDQITLYLEGVRELPAVERTRLLRRRAPWAAYIRPIWKTVRAIAGGKDTKERHDFSLPLDCPMAA